MDNRVSILKVRQVTSPVRANANDAGTDFYIPDYNDQFMKDIVKMNSENNVIINTRVDDNKKTVMDIIIGPFSSIKIPSGIKVCIHDKDTFLQVTNKSGIASKLELDVMANCVDADYTGEVIFNLKNTTPHAVVVTTGMKIVQVVHREYIRTDWQEVDVDTYNGFGATDRGDGGFGSTGVI